MPAEPLPDLAGYGLAITGVLGSGASGSVYRANQPALGNREVAVKVVRPELASTLGLLEREIQAVTRLRHPNIVVVHQAQTTGEPLFLVMELADSPAPAVPMSLSGAVKSGIKLCSALALAHEKGIVHSDLKPENILWIDNEPLLGDFGTACIATRTRLRSDVGMTPAWAPRWLLQQPADKHSDVWSLAAVILWLATGALPHEVIWADVPGGLAEVLRPVMPDVPPLPPLDSAPAATLGRQLQELQHRHHWPITPFPHGQHEDWTPAADTFYPPAADEDLQVTVPIDAAPTQPRTQLAPLPPVARRRRLWLVSPIFAVALGGAAIAYAQSQAGTNDDGSGVSGASTAATGDGATSSASSDEAKSSTTQARQLPTDQTAAGLQTSDSDSRSNPTTLEQDLVFAGNQAGNFDLFTLRADGQVDVLLQRVGDDTSPSLSPDRTLMVFESSEGGARAVYLAPVDGSSEPRQLSPEGTEAGEPAWSPDGSQIAWISRANGNWDIVVHDLNTGTETFVVTGASDDRSPSWAPDGSALAFRSDRTGNGDIYTLMLSSQAVKQVTSTPDRDDHPAWGVGNQLAHERWLGSDSEVFVTDLQKEEESRITTNPGFDGAPAYVGDRLVIVRQLGTETQLVADPASAASILYRSAGQVRDLSAA